MFLYLLSISLSLHLVYIAAFGGGLSVFWQFVEFSLLWSFLTVDGVGQAACQGFLIREACVGVLVGGAGFCSLWSAMKGPVMSYEVSVVLE